MKTLRKHSAGLAGEEVDTSIEHFRQAKSCVALRFAHPTGTAALAIVIFAFWTVGAAFAEDAYSDVERGHWSLVPRVQAAVPVFSEKEERDWVRTPVDAFILARLKQEGLEPAREADAGTLVRRLSFSLTGLPPTPEEISRFVGDQRPDAYERLVDRLLASPHYGEAWAQHWLDVARYSESEGFEYDRHRPGAWRLRE
jgi:hypothetical protein